MFKRLSFCIVTLLWLPITMSSMLIGLVLIYPICFIRWIINGGNMMNYDEWYRFYFKIGRMPFDWFDMW